MATAKPVSGAIRCLRGADRLPVRRVADKNIPMHEPFCAAACVNVTAGKIGKQVCKLHGPGPWPLRHPIGE
jgi:hypothetical protein